MPSLKRRALPLVLLVVGIFCASCWYLYHRATSDTDLFQKEVALCRSEGLLVSDFRALLPKTPARKNAATAYTEAIRLSKSGTMPTFNMKNLGDLKKAQTFVDAWTPAIQAIEKNGNRPDAVFSHNYKNLSAEQLPELPAMQNVSQAITVRAELESVQGESGAAMTDLARVALIAHHAGQWPGFLGIITQFRIERLVFDELERVLTRAPEQAPHARSILVNWSNLPLFTSMLRGELFQKAQQLEIFATEHRTASLSAGPDFLPEPNISMPPDSKRINRINPWTLQPAVRNRLFAAALHVYRVLLEQYAKARGLPDLIQSGAQMDRRLDQSQDVGDELAKLWHPPFERIFQIYACALAQRRLATAAIALLQTNPLPNQLPLRGQLSIDPSTGNPLHYQQTTKGFQIYGLGTSGIDDGGHHQTPLSNPSDTDLVFTYPLQLSSAKKIENDSP